MQLRTNSWAYQITRLQIYPTILKTVSKWTSENLPGCGFYSLVPTPAVYLYPNSLGHSINGDCRPGLLWSAPGTVRPRSLCSEHQDTGDGESDLSLRASWFGRVPSLHNASWPFFMAHSKLPEMSFNSHKNLLLGATIVQLQSILQMRKQTQRSKVTCPKSRGW